MEEVIIEDPWNGHTITLQYVCGTILLVDPYLINVDDLIREIPQGPRIVRLRRPGWGKERALANAITVIALPGAESGGST